MDITKSWWASTTIWASILQMGVGVATATGMLNDAAGGAIISEGPGLLVGAATVILGAISIWGRVRATKVVSTAGA